MNLKKFEEATELNAKISSLKRNLATWDERQTNQSIGQLFPGISDEAFDKIKAFAKNDLQQQLDVAVQAFKDL